ncbi:fad-linked sulfhydryl oxidase erv1 [Phtheirospermum japonicum]|uniref:Sulfhydryl oxidase n=1 Tax=Phtheirospermum japonicum TaxID=374723 RepID=A0A830CKX1_9LAMI|nr:fad-linked sulfhydryl oxidase erv1 [Phtheirospermum japonicum]
MSENPLQLLFQAFDKVSECIQSHLSQFVLRPGGPSSSFSTNQNQILSLSSPSTAASHLQPAEFLIKGKSTGPTTKEELGRATWTFLHTLAAQVSR